jgi:hypothetical protein
MLLISLTVAEDKNSILARKRCCHLSDPVPSVRIPGVFIDFMKTKYPHFNQLDSLEKLKIIHNPGKEILPSVCNFIKRSLEARHVGQII